MKENGFTLAQNLFTICLDYVLGTLINLIKVNGFTLAPNLFTICLDYVL